MTMSALEKLREMQKRPAPELIIHMVDSGKGPVTAHALQQALAWDDYLESQARRIYGAAGMGDIAAARALLERIQRGELTDGFRLRDIYRKHWAQLSTKEAAERAVKSLLQRHYLILEVNSLSGNYGDRYWINPKI